MKKGIVTLIGMIMLSGSMMAQEDFNGEDHPPMGPRPEMPDGGRPRNGMDRPGGPGRGMGRPGGRSSEVKYAGATELTTATTQTAQTYVSEKADESALLIST